MTAPMPVISQLVRPSGMLIDPLTSRKETSLEIICETSLGIVCLR